MRCALHRRATKLVTGLEDGSVSVDGCDTAKHLLGRGAFRRQHLRARGDHAEARAMSAAGPITVELTELREDARHSVQEDHLRR